MSAAATPGPDRGVPFCPLRLDLFQGPLDLLLHLVRSRVVDLADISITEVVRQCDEYLALMRHLDLEAAGDHLVLAATLVHLKSRRFLPDEPPAETTSGEESEGGAGVLDRSGLAVKRAAEGLQEREALMGSLYGRPAERVAEYAGEQGIEADLASLVRAFQAILQRCGGEAAGRISREQITLVERIGWLVEILRQARRVDFQSLFSGLADRLSCILTFLALLEVIRLKLARAYAEPGAQGFVIVLTEGVALPPGHLEVQTDA